MVNYKDLEGEFNKHWFRQIIKYKDAIQDLSCVSANVNLDENIIQDNPDFPWDDNHLVFNDSLSWQFYKNRFTKALKEGPLTYGTIPEQVWLNNKAWTTSRFAWEHLSEHPNIVLQDIYQLKEQPWDFPELITHKNVTQEDISKYFIHGCLVDERHKHHIIPLSSTNPNISIQHMLSHSHYNWRWHEVLRRPEITIEQFKCIFPKLGIGEIDVDIDLSSITYSLSQCPVLTWEFVLQHPEVEWAWDMLSRHPNIPVELIFQNPEYNWVWRQVSENPNLKWEHVSTHLDFDWCWELLSLHPNITWDIVKQNLHYPWNWYFLSQNKNIGWDTVNNNKDKPWNYRKLSLNTMPRYKKDWIANTRRKWIAANRIHRFWREVCYNPKYPHAQRYVVKSILNK